MLAASLVLLSLLGSLATVAAVQTAANARLAASLTRETNANTALNEANGQLTKSRAAVEARYKLATDAIKTFHTGVSEDFLLKEEKFKELRDRLLKSASDFYGKLGALLGKETDIASRRALAQSNFELGDLTGKVGRNEDALAAHRAVLARRLDLAAEPAAGGVAKVDVGRSLIAVAGLLEATGKTDEALASYRRSESLLAGPAGADPSAQAALAACRSQTGLASKEHRASPPTPWPPCGFGADKEALAAAPEASADARRDWRTLPTSRCPAVGRGQVSERRPSTAGPGDSAEARRRPPRRYRIPQPAWRQPRHRRVDLHDSGQAGGGGGRVPQRAGDPQKLADDNPAVTEFRSDLAVSHDSLGAVLWQTGKPSEAEAEYRKAVAIARSWPTTTPPSPDSAARWRRATTPRHVLNRHGQASGGGGRVPQDARDPAEAGRRQPRRHRIPQSLAHSH